MTSTHFDTSFSLFPFAYRERQTVPIKTRERKSFGHNLRHCSFSNLPLFPFSSFFVPSSFFYKAPIVCLLPCSALISNCSQHFPSFFWYSLSVQSSCAVNRIRCCVEYS